MKTAQAVLVAALVFLGVALTSRADDLRVFPAALLQQANTWLQLQTFSAGTKTAGMASFGNATYGAPGTNPGEKVQLFGTSGTASNNDYALGLNAGELWANTPSGFVDWYVGGVKAGGVGLAGYVFPKLSAAPSSAPGAGITTVFAVAGTNSGTCKLQAMAGTSNTPVTIIDNVGSGC